jgi:hypothetical protein
MKRIVIECETNWTGMNELIYLQIPDDMELDDQRLLDYARQRAVENAEAYDVVQYIAEELFEPDEEGSFTEEQWSEAYTRLDEYIDFSIDLFDEDDMVEDSEWETFYPKE